MPLFCHIVLDNARARKAIHKNGIVNCMQMKGSFHAGFELSSARVVLKIYYS